MTDTEQLLNRLNEAQKKVNTKKEELAKLEKDLLVEQTKYNQFLEELKAMGVTEDQLEEKLKELYTQAEEKVIKLESILKELDNGTEKKI